MDNNSLKTYIFQESKGKHEEKNKQHISNFIANFTKSYPELTDISPCKGATLAYMMKLPGLASLIFNP